MAVVNATNMKLALNEALTVAVSATATGTDGVSISYKSARDTNILLLLGGATGTAVIKKGDMLQATEDLSVSVTSSGEVAIVIESGKFVNSDGNVLITGVSGLTVKAFELPV